jgi:carbon monoxide dehydrogenase subunit G
VKVERSIEIAAPPDAVYDVVMDPARLEQWVTVHKELLQAPNGVLEEGDELAQKLKIAGQGFKVKWTVAKAQRPRDVEWEGRGPMGTKARVSYDLEPRGDGTTCFNYVNEYELPGGALGKLGAKAVARTAGKEADRTLVKLKGLLER